LQNNHSLLVSLGMAHAYSGDYKQAILPLKAAHVNDSLNMKGMDLLSFLLWNEKRGPELEKLMTRLVELNYNDTQSEPWVALAYFAQHTNRSARGLYFAHRGSICRGIKNAEGLIVKGNILLDMKKCDDAIECFRDALTYTPYRFEPHKGIVDCYITMQRHRDALAIATAASKKLGQTPRTLTMCAAAMCRDTLTVTKAKLYLERAFNQDITYLPAVNMMVEILEREGQYTASIQLLLKLTENSCSSSQIHLKLAELLCKANNEDKAAEHFAIALRLDPNNRDAKDGLSRLDPSTSRSSTHDSVNNFELLDEADFDEEEDDHDVIPYL